MHVPNGEASPHPVSDRRQFRCALVTLALLASCTSSHPPETQPTLAQTSRIATHNSYWVNRGVPDEGASGVGEQILDQLLHDHVRVFELDIHPDPAAPHHFLVYHTSPPSGPVTNAVCTDLPSCLRPVALLNNGKAAAIVVLELGVTQAPTFDAHHTPEDLDAELLASAVNAFRPQDLLARCDADQSVAGCVAARSWPSELTLQSDMIFAVVAGPSAPLDWLAYATAKPITQRVAFPMGRSAQRDFAKLAPDIQAAATSAAWEAAWAQTAFIHVAKLDDPLLKPALAANQIVRAENIATAADRAAAKALGVQLWQTDWPWDANRADDLELLPTAPDFASVPHAWLVESTTVPAPAAGETSTHDWDTSPNRVSQSYAWLGGMATGLAQGVTPCFAAAVEDDPDVDGASLCKRKHPGPRSSPGVAAPADAQAETVSYLWRTCHGGQCVDQVVHSEEQVLDMGVDCRSGNCCVTPSFVGFKNAWIGIDGGPMSIYTTNTSGAACFGAKIASQGRFTRWNPAIDNTHTHVDYFRGLGWPLD